MLPTSVTELMSINTQICRSKYLVFTYFLLILQSQYRVSNPYEPQSCQIFGILGQKLP